MAHVIRDKNKLLNRVHRIKGQVDAIERSLEEGAECTHILHSIAACRGAIDGLMAEVLEAISDFTWSIRIIVRPRNRRRRLKS